MGSGNATLMSQGYCFFHGFHHPNLADGHHEGEPNRTAVLLGMMTLVLDEVGCCEAEESEGYDFVWGKAGSCF